MAEPEPGRHSAENRRQPPLPTWFRVVAIGALVATFAAHIILDVLVDDYEGRGTSLMLGGIVGTALGLNEYLRRGGN